jgi:hypothetical protein
MLTALLLAVAVQSDAPEPKWLTKYADALAQAKATGKPLVVDAGRKG